MVETISHTTVTSAISGQVSVAPQEGTSRARGLSSGAVAGIAIATALIGIAIGAIAAVFLKRRGGKYKAPPNYAVYSDREKEAPISPGTHDALPVDQALLDAQSDTALASELRSLNQLIKEHAETHYRTDHVQMESSSLRQPLDDLGIERGNAPVIARLASLALEPRTRLKAIRYVIAKTVFESTVIGGSACVSMLPPVASGLGASIPRMEDDIGRDEASEIALTRWRQLTAFLLNPDRGQLTPLVPSEDISTQQAQQLTLALNRFLEPFFPSDREERYEQENSLRELVAECATFGYVIFSQPAEYRFRYDSNGGLNTLVVFPGLDRISDEEGRRYRPPEPRIAPPVVESV
ncbi:hypothetical protein F5Y17DRAFT_47221 [Xylariaceae sp. FL0594]|nr:hypothetical protein F5Y17DRAFT_47221 [Xylariaceae sp. FL0594]